MDDLLEKKTETKRKENESGCLRLLEANAGKVGKNETKSSRQGHLVLRLLGSNCWKKFFGSACQPREKVSSARTQSPRRQVLELL
jgi:hypothetical protein